MGAYSLTSGEYLKILVSAVRFRPWPYFNYLFLATFRIFGSRFCTLKTPYLANTLSMLFAVAAKPVSSIASFAPASFNDFSSLIAYRR
jgi:hypothetical protein